jgi:mono/diheme cytochrome c family protein
MADWMVSIPAVRKHPELPEYAFQVDATSIDNIGGPVVDTSPQPYVEVAPGAPGYDDASLAAQQRLSILHSGSNAALPSDPVSGKLYSRYADPADTSDILDPAVLVDPICHPIPTPNGSSAYPLPNHPHWVNTDLSQNPGPWAPRQSNWPAVLVDQQIPPLGGGCASPAGVLAAYADQGFAVSLVQDATLDQVRAAVTSPLPFGLWQQKSGCNFSSAKKVSDFTGPARPHWMDVTNPAHDAPVFQQSAGAAVFKMICINCHGPLADSNGRMAQNLATMTGGNAAVADFRDGLFGPVGAAVGHRNMDAVYSVLPADASAKWTGVTVDDRAARYMAWMGLGGTSVNIPSQLLQLVAVTKVLDQRRLAAGQLSANMLSQAKSLCLSLLGTTFFDDVHGGGIMTPGAGHGYLDPLATMNSRLILANGDAELWLDLCSLANPQPVHILQPDHGGGPNLKMAVIEDSSGNLTIDGNNGQAPGALLPASLYPAGAPVGNVAGGTDPGLAPGNVWPWCIDDSAALPDQSAAYAAGHMPVCPQAVKDASKGCLHAQGTCFGNDDANRWAVRGAINAGFSVFLYVQSIENASAPPDYNQCELLK